MTYVVCRSCQYPHEVSYDLCPNCGFEDKKADTLEQFPNKVLAEAYAVGLWLKQGYSIHDIRDPYFNPKR